MMPINESHATHPEWAAFVEYLLQAHSIGDLAQAAGVHDYQVNQWLSGSRPAELQIEGLARHFDWSVIRQLRALDAAGYLETPRISRTKPGTEPVCAEQELTQRYPG